LVVLGVDDVGRALVELESADRLREGLDAEDHRLLRQEEARLHKLAAKREWRRVCILSPHAGKPSWLGVSILTGRVHVCIITAGAAPSQECGSDEGSEYGRRVAQPLLGDLLGEPRLTGARRWFGSPDQYTGGARRPSTWCEETTR
jgi:hypothetical protein